MKVLSNATPDFSNLVELLRGRALRQPDRRAYTFLADGEAEEVHLTYGDLDRQARAIAAILQNLNAAGERALLLYPPGLDYIAAFFGCLYAKVIAVPVYPPDPIRLERTLPRLLAIARDSQARFLLATQPIQAMADTVLSVAPDLKLLQWIGTDAVDAATADAWKESGISRDEVAFLQYTSGSTGQPKGVMISHGNLLHNLMLIDLAVKTTSNSRLVNWLPQYHDMGLVTGFLSPLYKGFPATHLSPVDFLQRPLRWLRTVSLTQTTHSGGPSFAYDLCVRKITAEQKKTLDLSRWEVAWNGAEPIRRETLERFTEAFMPCGFRPEAFMPCYGLAECTVGVSWSRKEAKPLIQMVRATALEKGKVHTTSAQSEGVRSVVGCGPTPRDQRILIVNPETCTRCGPDEVGEIWVSGPSVARGYWNRPEETKESFQAYLKDTGEGPFLRTGDLGFLKDGELFVTGRIKDLLIIGGLNHYPQDIEKTVEQSHPSLRPGCCAAFAVDIEGEERLVIAAELDHGDPPPDQETLMGDIKQAVAREHGLTIHDIAFLKARTIPKTSSGKVQRYACKKGFLSGSLERM